jgi:hypothetical protein
MIETLWARLARGLIEPLSKSNGVAAPGSGVSDDVIKLNFLSVTRMALILFRTDSSLACVFFSWFFSPTAVRIKIFGGQSNHRA